LLQGLDLQVPVRNDASGLVETLVKAMKKKGHISGSGTLQNIIIDNNDSNR
jgi:hypothetical protein